MKPVDTLSKYLSIFAEVYVDITMRAAKDNPGCRVCFVTDVALKADAWHGLFVVTLTLILVVILISPVSPRSRSFHRPSHNSLGHQRVRLFVALAAGVVACILSSA